MVWDISILLAQATQPYDAANPFPAFSTVAGIISVTFFVTEVVKYLIAGIDVPMLRKVPTWVHAVLVSFAVTAVAKWGLGAISGDYGPLMYTVLSVVFASSASGFFSWFKRISDTPGHKLRVLLPVCLVVLLGAGCSGVPVRATASYHASVGERWLRYVEADAELTQPERDTYRAAHLEFGELIERVAGQEGTPLIAFPATQPR